MTRVTPARSVSSRTGMVHWRSIPVGSSPLHLVPDQARGQTEYGQFAPRRAGTARGKVSPMYPELRNDRRFTCQARFFGSGGTFLFRGAVTDISRTGLCLSGVAPMARGQAIHLKVDLPSGSVEAVGEVRWVKAQDDGLAEVGLRFVRINQSSLEAIDEVTADRPVTSTFMRQYVFR